MAGWQFGKGLEDSLDASEKDYSHRIAPLRFEYCVDIKQCVESTLESQQELMKRALIKQTIEGFVYAFLVERGLLRRTDDEWYDRLIGRVEERYDMKGDSAISDPVSLLDDAKAYVHKYLRDWARKLK